MTTQTKLELTWPGKHKRPRLEPRILLEDKALSHHAAPRTAPDLVEQAADAAPTAFDDNLLIQGDNLLALKALEGKYAGKVKCVFIDPPYNTGSAFTHYDDGVEHSMWLTLIRDRLEIIRTLLAEDGSLWITIDDNEAHYLKVVCDEIFGRKNFVATCVWEKDKGGRGDADISLSHDNILVYAKERALWSDYRNLMPRTETQLGRFKNPDNDPRGAWRQGDDGTAKSGTEKQRFPVTLPSGRIVTPPPGRYWAFSKETLATARVEGRAYFGTDGDRLPIIKRYLTEVRDGVAPRTWWSADEVGTNQQAKRDHLNKLLTDIDPFSTPKPESLIQRIVHIATNPGDLVLDSFAGSGTTGAVAHKMGRRWIMVELGEHCHTHIVPRLKKVIDGDDPGGITKAVGWQGGGGFRYYRLAPSLLKKDKWGHWVINPEYNGEMLSEAMCKLMGFTYAPSQSSFWQHGRSTETDFIYVTTGSLSHDQLRVISEEVGNERSLLICCKAFMADVTAFPNLTLKKIPKTVLHKCEWDHDDYSFKIDVLAEAEPLSEEEDEFELNAGNEDAADA
ncbi:site-specific DNA-methyltransferase [Aquaspirillum sp. LM1]|uniref:site-specific DNA-methyltransferase n=1 Tax=Aquaspirillum sp. LM1 TaxID=1938604 RepID=UPI000983A6BC|nr:site-specific DNA-methyltransferase [Aquaspirillum sp. LM1]AQR64631.1 site-specific DNA-methyltransferase [Aquaspirillum sp. LM1]